MLRRDFREHKTLQKEPSGALLSTQRHDFRENEKEALRDATLDRTARSSAAQNEKEALRDAFLDAAA